MTDTKQPEALRLAEYFGKFWGKNDDEYKAATELRRLHEENESLLAANRDSTNHFDALMADHKKLQRVNQELLKSALLFQDYMNFMDAGDDVKGMLAFAELVEINAAAIAKAEGNRNEP
jgi:hypothetical protein